MNDVSQNNILKAKNTCVASSNSFGNTVSNDADTARFFAALTQVTALWYDMDSDGEQNNDLNSFGDILDGFGCTQTGRTPISPNFTCPDTLPFNSPTGVELQTHINNIVKPVLEDSIDRLDDISQSFNKLWIEPLDRTNVESDFGDVLVLRGLYKFMLATIDIGNSYDNDIDIDNASNAPHIEALLNSNPNLLKLSNTKGLPRAQNFLSEASDDTLDAIDWIQLVTDGQNNDWISIPPDVTTNEINEAECVVNIYKTSLTGPVSVDNGILNLSKFFDGIDLRSLIPPFNEDTPGFFPDPTFDNVWTNWDSDSNPNEDVDNNGIPDILE
jgi:hypothetical protein